MNKTGKLHLDICSKCNRILWLGILDFWIIEFDRGTYDTYTFHMEIHHGGTFNHIQRINLISNKRYTFEEAKEKFS